MVEESCFSVCGYLQVKPNSCLAGKKFWNRKIHFDGRDIKGGCLASSIVCSQVTAEGGGCLTSVLPPGAESKSFGELQGGCLSLIQVIKCLLLQVRVDLDFQEEIPYLGW